MSDTETDDGSPDGDLIETLPDWLVSRDEDDRRVSERLDRAIRILAGTLP